MKAQISGIEYSSRTRDLLLWAVEELRKGGIETPQLDAEVLLAHVLSKDRLELYLSTEDEVSQEEAERYRTLIKSRLMRMPVSYLTGHKEFMSLDFVVDKNVLIPRPETEVLVETVCRFGNPRSYVLELGTGSGAIAVSLARYNPDWYILATDISMSALSIARENARRHGVMDRISFLCGNLFSPISLRSKFDWVVSNPPYVPTCVIDSLPDGIRRYEPIQALDGGPDGMDAIGQILKDAWKVLRPGGQLAIEIGYGQSESVQEMARKEGRYLGCSIIKDYSGIPRVFHCRKDA